MEQAVKADKEFSDGEWHASTLEESLVRALCSHLGKHYSDRDQQLQDRNGLITELDQSHGEYACNETGHTTSTHLAVDLVLSATLASDRSAEADLRHVLLLQ